MKSLISLVVFFYLPILRADQTQTFIIEFGAENVHVVSASRVQNQYNVIIKNRTLLPLTGKIINDKKTFEVQVAVPADQDRNYPVNWNKNDHFYFLPLSPPYEKISLLVGKGTYEIPPKK